MPKVSSLLARHFPHSPTAGQQQFFETFERFFEHHSTTPAMLLRGYAGTGKTSIVTSLVKVLPLINYKFVLLAPTGRAAKVMSAYAKRMAFTIHKKIYKTASSDEPMAGRYQLQRNYHAHTLFIVDEASMIGNDKEFGSSGLLDDLVRFVFSGEHNKLMLIGDTAQLPPVFNQQSPALEALNLRNAYRLEVFEHELTEVMRQESDSGILYNATALRQQLKNEPPVIGFKTKGFSDIFRMSSEKLEDGLRYAYNTYGEEQTVIICRSNKAAVLYNRYIRTLIRFTENELEAGDHLMIVKNNYLFSQDSLPGGFIANGDFVEVRKIVSFQEMYGLRFADLQLAFLDYPDLPPFDAKIILDTLHQPEASLPDATYKKLYQDVKLDYEQVYETKTQVRDALKKDPFLNALQVKFAYALTCHKAQGGQWKAVFVDQGFLKDDMLNQEFIRWLYTALTRATDQLFLMNFNPTFFIS
jgi:ATP-dependent exoDNAse (exonuclease V) alpha subunit